MSMRPLIHRRLVRLVIVLGLAGMAPLSARSQEDEEPSCARKEAAGTSACERAETTSRLIEARVRAELLEMELGVEKRQIERLMTVVKESELADLLGMSESPLAGDGERLERAKKLLEQRMHDYLERSRELARVEDRRAELEGQLAETGEEMADSRRLADLARRLDKAIDAMDREEADDESPKEHSRVSEALRSIQSLLKAFEDDDP